jgi:hypothetical protein
MAAGGGMLAKSAPLVLVVLLSLAAAYWVARPVEAGVHPPADFEFVSESAVFNPSTGHVTFTLEFTKEPDFWTADLIGRQREAFQYLVFGDPNLQYPTNYDAEISGHEIFQSVDTIRIRRPNSTEPGAGWGPVVGSAPFDLDGTLLTFSVPLDLLTSRHPNGIFKYYLASTDNFGGTTRSVVSWSTSSASTDPLPPAVGGTAGLVTGMSSPATGPAPVVVASFAMVGGFVLSILGLLAKYGRRQLNPQFHLAGNAGGHRPDLSAERDPCRPRLHRKRTRGGQSRRLD